MAVFYTQKDGCMENKILLGVNGGLCLLISVVVSRLRFGHLSPGSTGAFDERRNKEKGRKASG